ncbi:LysR family transcriptional regulator [Candidatus Uabimicrobium sp. HlEnr_7]|uniref:LysR family transcriptional regulator n=1 Tax=Candidatus Uabimicrobium helgolandensis TaxID=3095367 RepID=UPI003557D546
MKNFDQIDSKYFEVFWVASETLNFTKTAQIIHVTQSAVTQQIKKLETQMETQLFVRAQKNIYLTPAGKKLRFFIENYLDNVDTLIRDIKQSAIALSGKIRYALPESCLLSSHFTKLLNYRQNHFPQLHLQVEICTSEIIYDKVLSCEIDFGFITKKKEIQSIDFIPFCEEQYIWIAKEKSLERLSASEIVEQEMIIYPGMEVLYKKWCESQKKSYPAFSRLKVTGMINHLHGALDMVASGMGITIIPKHCLQNQQKQLSQICKGRKVMNTIYIITLENVKHPKRVEKIIDVFLEMHK